MAETSSDASRSVSSFRLSTILSTFSDCIATPGERGARWAALQEPETKALGGGPLLGAASTEHSADQARAARTRLGPSLLDRRAAASWGIPVIPPCSGIGTCCCCCCRLRRHRRRCWCCCL